MHRSVPIIIAQYINPFTLLSTATIYNGNFQVKYERESFFLLSFTLLVLMSYEHSIERIIFHCVAIKLNIAWIHGANAGHSTRRKMHVLNFETVAPTRLIHVVK